ncbi:MAG: DNA polymerase III subunit alpha [Bacilli bacterium]|nr:DNA polymerase III subunit alpha [Bacilli bacterium]
MYTPLYIKTNNSLLSSMIKIDDLIAFALKNNLKALTITDNNMYGVLDFYYACLKNNIKPIIGLEINLEDKFVLYAKDQFGYKNLIKLATLQSEETLTIKDLNIYNSNLVCIIPYTSKKLYKDLSKIYLDLFIGYRNPNERLKIKSDKTVYFNEILCLDHQDEEYLKYLYAIRDGILVNDVVLETHDVYLDLNVFEKYPEDKINNQSINEMCNLEITHEDNLLPIYEYPEGMDSYRYLKKLCKEGLKRIFGETVNRIYLDRLNYELEVINKMGFCNYFLVVWDLIKYAKSNHILVGPGRGSAAGSLVAYILDITTIDPIKYNLLFERFLNPERITMPDIDIDFQDTKRDEVLAYCINKYGLKRVIPIIAFGTLGAKQAVRDVGRVIDTDIKIIDHLCRLLDSKKTLLENYQTNQKLQNYLNNLEELKEVYKVASKIEGMKRHTTVHAAGVVMANTDLDNIIPLEKSHEHFYTTGYDMTYLEGIGLLKIDLLAIRNLTIIDNIIRDINLDLTFDNIPINDPKALNLFTTANTLGIFQFESSGMMNFLRKFKPRTFEDIFAAIALFRPGPMKNIDSYIRRQHGQEKIEYLHPSLEPILKSTNGIIVYQEQIMQIAHVMASYSMGEADVLRRAMSKKKESILLKEKEKFINNSLKNGYSEEVALKVYNLILKFAEYGFNRSHSVAYATVAYKMAYLKAHYPHLFMKNLLTIFTSSEKKVKEYIYDCKQNNIDLLKPDINISTDEYTIENSSIRFPLIAIKGIGISSVKSIVEEREKGNFKDIYDFMARCFRYITPKILENLIFAGAFDSLGINKKTLYTNLDVLINYSELASYLDEEYALKPELQKTDEYDNKELMKYELEVFGFYLSNHPVTEYKHKLSNIVSINELDNYFDKFINTIIYVERVKTIDTKKNDKMCFITGSDEAKMMDFVLFPKIYEIHTDIKVGDVLLIKGKVEKRFDKLQVIVDKIKKLNEVER